MSAAQEGLKILAKAETALRALMRREIDAERYGDLALLALLADEIASLKLRAVEPNNFIRNRPPEAAPPAPAKRRLPKSAGHVQKSKYPRFRIDEDCIVKVGWSKKSGEEYEHHAPHESAITLASYIDSAHRPGRIWSVEELGTVSTADLASEVPVYQIYLLIAWMRSLGIVVKHGRSGYSSTSAAGLQASVQAAISESRSSNR